MGRARIRRLSWRAGYAHPKTGETPLGDTLRELLLDINGRGIHATAELALLFASRAQLVAEVIAPALSLGAWFWCERFMDSREGLSGRGAGTASTRPS